MTVKTDVSFAAVLRTLARHLAPVEDDLGEVVGVCQAAARHGGHHQGAEGDEAQLHHVT